MIYLDNSATTQPHPEVLESYKKVADKFFANPSSVHRFGSEVERLLQQTRNQAAEWFGVQPKEVIFTSGGTEGNNMAIKGIALMHQSRGKHLITSQVEHPSVIEAFRAMESLGFDVTYLPVDSEGKVNPQDVSEAMREDTILVSIMSVNNELGTIQPIQEIGGIVNEYPKAFFHVDHVQGLGKIDVSLNKDHIDLCTVSGHKVHGLKGTGALLMKQEVLLFPLLHGGGQEQEKRAGTENLPGSVAFVKALRFLFEDQEKKRNHLNQLRESLWNELQEIEGVFINSPKNGAPHILNFSVPGFKPEVLIHTLSERDIYISTKSACSSKQPDVSAVLKACNVDRERTTSALRVSMSYTNTEEELMTFVQALKASIEQLQVTMGR
ncbi:cysteine desulfurase [Halobacillus litoralis]|uniref:cysteine desulfurase family protein n=1 Tax=Halobacillus litoralis TaxID=45668 RepID=UPI001CD790B8|nr:cysteine desulfurase family protein [Halobacillus litoralis]MCA0969804.1 cysteine desulfurase [Halobacillus litoralis]